MGLPYLTAVAPCMGTPEVWGRFADAAARGDVDVEVGHTGDFDDPDRFIRIRACSDRQGGLWLAHLRA